MCSCTDLVGKDIEEINKTAEILNNEENLSMSKILNSDIEVPLKSEAKKPPFKSIEWAKPK